MRPNPGLLTRLILRLRGRDPVKEYFEWLTKFGRVADGRILDFQQDETGITIFYRYNVSNVDYETSQRLSSEQLARKHMYVPGAHVIVRYDNKNPGISIVP